MEGYVSTESMLVDAVVSCLKHPVAVRAELLFNITACVSSIWHGLEAVAVAASCSILVCYRQGVQGGEG